MVSSYPLFMTDVWYDSSAGPGWIHTPYDNSSSTETLGWVTVSSLEGQLRVAGLSVMRVLGVAFSPFVSQVFIVSAVSVVAVVAFLVYERRRVGAVLVSAYDEAASHVELKEVLYIVLLTALFMFSSFVLHTRFAKVEIVDNGYPTPVYFMYYGFPFEMVGVGSNAALPSESASDTLPVISSSFQGGTSLLWQGFLLDLGFCVLLAFSLVYAVMKVMAIREYAAAQRSTIETRALEA
jgi:hypothetical protein